MQHVKIIFILLCLSVMPSQYSDLCETLSFSLIFAQSTIVFSPSIHVVSLKKVVNIEYIYIDEKRNTYSGLGRRCEKAWLLELGSNPDAKLFLQWKKVVGARNRLSITFNCTKFNWGDGNKTRSDDCILN